MLGRGCGMRGVKGLNVSNEKMKAQTSIASVAEQ